MSIRSIVPTARSGSTGKIVSAREAVQLIRAGDTVALGGFFGIGLAVEVIHELAAVFQAADEESAALGKPRDLTLVFCVSPGDAQSGGANRLAQPGLVKRIIGGHWTGVPALYQLVAGNQVEGYNLPLGPMSQLYLDIAAGKPGHLSRVGLGTFADPRFSGGKLNEMTTEDLVEVMEIGGQEYLFYKAFPVDVAIIRGTTADPAGNITMEREALTCDTLALAMAAHSSGGLVIAQVERVAEVNTLNPRQVKIPGALVDCIVVATDPGNHMQSWASPYNPAFSAEVRVPLTSLAPMPMSDRKIIARRAAMELRANSVVNLGVGIPEGVASVAAEEKIADLMTLTAEPGVIGGIPAGGLNFGAAINAQTVIDQPYQFDFYDGGGLDVAFLGLAQADREGNLNVSKFGPRLAGAGGFINISQNAKKVVFVGTFVAGRLQLAVKDGRLDIVKDGELKKFVREVEHRTFSGSEAVKREQPVLYVTERCVFELSEAGLELIEVAPGIDIDRDILARMDFKPIMRRDPVKMDQRIFSSGPMGLRDDLLRMPFDQRFTYHPRQNQLFVNFEGHVVRNHQDVDRIRRMFEALLTPLGKKVHVIVNYDNFQISPDIIDEYSAMVSNLADRFYSGATRYTTSGFLRSKLGDAFNRRAVAPHIFETAAEAHAHLRELEEKKAS